MKNAKVMKTRSRSKQKTMFLKREKNSIDFAKIILVPIEQLKQSRLSSIDRGKKSIKGVFSKKQQC